MTTEATPGALGSNEQLGLAPEREELRATPAECEAAGEQVRALLAAQRKQHAQATRSKQCNCECEVCNCDFVGDPEKDTRCKACA